MAPKSPTNADIYKKLDNMDSRILALENWHFTEEAYKKARLDITAGEDSGKRRRLINNLGTFMMALTLLVYLIIQHFGGK